MAERIRPAAAEERDLRDHPRIGAGAGLSAGRWRPGLDARRPPARASSTARTPGQYGVEQFYQDTLAGSPRVLDWRDRDLSGRAMPGDRRGQAGRADRRGPAPHHRRRPPARRGAGAAGGLDRRQGQERVGGRDGSVHRRGLRRGDLPVVRRQPVPLHRRDGPGALHRPDRAKRLRARVRSSR